MELHLRRVRRADFEQIRALTEAMKLEPPSADRAALRRFRNIVGDLGSDFDVAVSPRALHGFVHLAYARDLLAGNRAQLLALVGDSRDVRRMLFARAIDRAGRRQCRDLTAVGGPWLDSASVCEFAGTATLPTAGLQVRLNAAPAEPGSGSKAYRLHAGAGVS